jgi:CheY-like chemotaxis protein
MNVVLFDRDPTIAKLVATAASTKFNYVCAVSEDEAFSAVEAESSPSILLIRWSSIAPFAKAFAQRWAAIGRGALVALLSPSELDQLPRALAIGVDDVVLGPFSAPALVARLEVLSWRVRAPSGRKVAAVIRMALDHPDGGEVIIRAGDDVARVFVVSGSVAWVQDPRDTRPFLETLHDLAPNISREEFVAVLEESRQTKKHFGAILVAWDLMTREAFDSGMAKAIKSRLDAVLAWPESSAFFAPGQQAFSGPTVAIDSVMAGRPRSSNSALVAAPPSILSSDELRSAAKLVNQLMGQSGIVGAAVFDETLAVCVAQKGEVGEVEGAWAQINTLSAFGAETQDAIVARGDRWYVARRSPITPRLVAHVVFDGKTIVIGLARHLLAKVVAEG